MDSADDLPKGGVSPFGHPRINDRSHLPAAFRSVPRPSSPLGAKASTGRPYTCSGRRAQPARARPGASNKQPNQPPSPINQPTNQQAAPPPARRTEPRDGQTARQQT